MLTYKDHLIGAMELLAANPKTFVVGYNSSAGGTCHCFPKERSPEMPLAEALCAGVAIGMSLNGFVPILWIERMDFILHSLDQIVNHLDKMALLSNWIHKPAVIIRVATGNKNTPLLTGPTHTQNFSYAIREMVTFPIINLQWRLSIVPEYKKALDRAIQGQSTMLVEDRDLYFTSD
jgi:pyruvate/2-oxoglutarate/acetoin dehydrogenase E1 component